MFKKTNLLLLAFLFILSLSGCKETEVKEDDFVNDFTTYTNEQMALMINDFLPEENQEYPYENVNYGYPQGKATLWDQSAFFTTAVRYYKLNDLKDDNEYFKKVDNALNWYEDTFRSDYLVYASENGNEKPAYYDDNVWVLLGMIELYQATEDTDYLDKAKSMTDYIYTGWDPINGGLLWREYERDAQGNYLFYGDYQKVEFNTCINGPAIMASAKMYQITNDQKYLDWAVKIYEWTKENLGVSTGMYYDRVELTSDGQKTVDKTVYTYNLGTMISSGVYLYQITEQQSYLDDALKTAKAAEQYKGVTYDDVPNAVFYISESEPWFRVYLLQGYLDLAKVDINNSIYIERAKNAMIYAYENGIGDNGYLKMFWGKGTNDGDNTYIRHITGNTECLGVIAEYLDYRNSIGK